MIALLVMTDGRDRLLDQTLDSATDQLNPGHLITRRFIWDDTGNTAHHAATAIRYPTFEVIGNGRRNGFGGAIREAWARVRVSTDEPFVLHLEDDFTFEKPVDLGEIAGCLTLRLYLAQMALRRQPWNDTEKAAGGVVEADPQAFEEKGSANGNHWLEHRKFWTTNPSLFRRQILDVGWPDEMRSEGHFTHRLLDDGFELAPADELRFGYWGRRDSGVWVRHLGDERVGHGY